MQTEELSWVSLSPCEKDRAVREMFNGSPHFLDLSETLSGLTIVSLCSRLMVRNQPLPQKAQADELPLFEPRDGFDPAARTTAAPADSDES